VTVVAAGKPRAVAEAPVVRDPLGARALRVLGEHGEVGTRGELGNSGQRIGAVRRARATGVDP
jgi:hypothetical protein